MDMNVHVLVIDDFSTMRLILKRILRVIGLNRVTEAKDGKDAIEILNKDDIGLILCDWNMPKMSGLDLLKFVRSDEKLKDIPFIMVTAEGQKSNIMAAVDAGVSNYILKPFTLETIREKIKNIFKN